MRALICYVAHPAETPRNASNGVISLNPNYKHILLQITLLVMGNLASVIK